jgi:Restriction endonuclease
MDSLSLEEGDTDRDCLEGGYFEYRLSCSDMNTDEHLEELFQEIENVSKEQIKSEFNSFTQAGMVDEEAKECVMTIEALSSEFGTERETAKSELVGLYNHSLSPREARLSAYTKRKFPDQMDNTQSDQSTNSPSGSESDYQPQRENGYPENWDKLRTQAYERDEYECQNCGLKEGSGGGEVVLHAHHIVPVSKGGNHCMSNLATLCQTCHSKIHPHMSSNSG